MLLFESENWLFNSNFLNLTSKNLFDLKIDIWILNYYFGILIYNLIQKNIDWVLRVFSTNVIHNKYFYK